MQCGPDEPSSFTNANVGPGTYVRLRQGLVPYIGYKGVNVAVRPPGALKPQVCNYSFSEPRSEPKSRMDSGAAQKQPSRNWQLYGLKSAIVSFQTLALNQSPEQTLKLLMSQRAVFVIVLSASEYGTRPF